MAEADETVKTAEAKLTVKDVNIALCDVLCLPHFMKSLRSHTHTQSSSMPRLSNFTDCSNRI